MFGRDKIKLFTNPTPLQKLENISKELGVELYIKRDDMAFDIGMGGNKLRKLEYLLAEAEKQGATMLLTYGGAQTNHGRLTAAAAAKRGMKCAIVAVDEHPENMNANLLLDRLMGCEVYIAKPDGSENQAKNLGAKIKAEWEAKGEKVYEIPVGGSNTVGILGYIDCAYELYEQMKMENIADAKVFCGAGSLGTYLGLWLGMKLQNAPCECVGVSISPVTEAKDKRVMEYFGEVKAEYNLEIEAERKDFHIETGYVREGYNKPDENVRKAIYLMASNEAIILDPCYTGKVFAGIIDMINEGKIAKGEKIVLVHTGGSPAIYTPFHRAEMEKELMEGYHLL